MFSLFFANHVSLKEMISILDANNITEYAYDIRYPDTMYFEFGIDRKLAYELITGRI